MYVYIIRLTILERDGEEGRGFAATCPLTIALRGMDVGCRRCLFACSLWVGAAAGKGMLRTTRNATLLSRTVTWIDVCAHVFFLHNNIINNITFRTTWHSYSRAKPCTSATTAIASTRYNNNMWYVLRFNASKSKVFRGGRGWGEGNLYRPKMCTPVWPCCTVLCVPAPISIQWINAYYNIIWCYIRIHDRVMLYRNMTSTDIIFRERLKCKYANRFLDP